MKMVDTGQRKEFDQLMSEKSDMHKLEHHISDSIDNSSIRDLSNVKLRKLPPHLKYILVDDELMIFEVCQDNVLRRWMTDDEVEESVVQLFESDKHLKGLKKKKEKIKSMGGKFKMKIGKRDLLSNPVVKHCVNGPFDKVKAMILFKPP